MAPAARGRVVLFPRDRSTRPRCGRAAAAGGGVVVVDRYFPGPPTDPVIFDDFAVATRSPPPCWTGATGRRPCCGRVRRTACGTGSPALSGIARPRPAELPERSALRVYSRWTGTGGSGCAPAGVNRRPDRRDMRQRAHPRSWPSPPAGRLESASPERWNWPHGPVHAPRHVSAGRVVLGPAARLRDGTAARRGDP